MVCSSAHFLNSGYQTGAWNMAIDEALFQKCKRIYSLREEKKIPAPIFLRVYGWSNPTISVGRFQNIKTDFDLEKSLSEGVDVCRRMSGGRAVLHDCELTYSIIGTSNLLGKKIPDTYEKISYALKIALDKLGVESDFVLPKKKVYTSSPSCFSTYSVREILCRGYKISGSAQFREGEAIIQHGNILFKSSEKKLSDFFQFKQNQNSLKEKNLGIFEILGVQLEFESVAEELKKAFQKVLDVKFDKYFLLDEDIENAEKLVEEKYNDLFWTKVF